MSFSDAYEEFKIYASKRHKKQGFDSLVHDFDLHILPYFNNLNLSDLSSKDIIFWQSNILQLNFKNSYNGKLYCAFNEFFKYCVLCGYITINWVSKVGCFKKKIEHNNYDVYTLKEFKKFRRGIDSLIYRYFFDFMYFCGTRPSEAMALRFSDLNGRIITINHNIHRRGKRELDTPKNQSSIRSFKISFILYLKLLYLKHLYVSQNGDTIDYFIFGGVKPLATTTIDRVKSRACQKQKIRCITQHQFRHSYATRLIHKGVPIDYVSRSMGHSKVSTTLDFYLHQEKRVI